MRIKKIIILIIGCVAAAAVRADDGSNSVSLSEVPAVVQKAIHSQVGDGKLESLDKTVDGGEITYDVETTAKDGQERDFTLDEDGTLVSMEVALSETPAAVQKTINTSVASGKKLESIDKIFDDSNITYHVEITTKDGQERDFTLDEDGTLVSMKVALSEMPVAVQKTINSQLGEGKLKSVNKIYDADGTTYDVEMMTNKGREKDFTVATDGTLVRLQVTLEETTPAVRKTIKERIGDGKILRIDKSFVEQNGVLPYEVQGRKEGKPFDFSVGPNGRFRGMDN
ncbi:MAG: PepSY-like domain-containing protein [Verrucomicrobiota bacterium]|jgi:uncharacterized membrane protein YkoI